MMYWLHTLEAEFFPFRIFQYITVRTVLGAGTAFLLCLTLGPFVIRKLREMSIGQVVRKQDAPAPDHEHKEGTPTMGGILIIFSIVVSCLLWARIDVIHVGLALGTLCVLGAVGFVDDYRKIRQSHSAGLSARGKLLLQGGWAVLVGVVLLMHPATSEAVRTFMVPFQKDPVITDMGAILSVLLVALVIVGASNAVNLTDGLDGLAIGCTSSVALTYLVMAYLAGHAAFAEYLYIPHIRGAGELAVFCGCVSGAALGFLWHNCHPAGVFMGDTGSLALGGAIGAVAILIKQEITLIIVGGVFVIEAISVIVQVLSIRLTGKRVFAMAPIHHHFEKKNWSETQVTIRFWILSILFALIGLMTLKIR